MLYRNALAFLALCLFFFAPIPPSPILPVGVGVAYAQSYSGTSATLAYGYYGGSNRLYCASEWFYLNNTGGSYMWSPNCVSFDLTITRYYSLSHFQNNNPFSTNTVTWVASVGEWMVEQWNPTTARISGAKYITLEGDYYFSISMQPRLHGSYKVGNYGSWSPFDWDGQVKTINLDLTYPGDG